MRASRALLVLAAGCAAFALVGCAQRMDANARTDKEPAAGGVCDAAPAQSAVGQWPSAALLESARMRAGARTARFIAHDQMTTREFNQQRLNLLLDAAGRVERVNCG